jgi:hypothetical protein
MTTLGWVGLAAAVFVATVALDTAWVRCVTAVQDLHTFRAGFWSAAVCTIGLVGLLGVTQCSVWLAIPEVAGAFTGTAWAVHRRRRARGAA